MKFRNRRVSALAAVTLVAGLALTGCGSDDGDGGSGGSAGGDTTVTFLPKNLGNPYFDTSADETPRPTPSATTNGMKPMPARNAL